jgi:hypothetical protein
MLRPYPRYLAQTICEQDSTNFVDFGYGGASHLQIISDVLQASFQIFTAFHEIFYIVYTRKVGS